MVSIHEGDLDDVEYVYHCLWIKSTKNKLVFISKGMLACSFNQWINSSVTIHPIRSLITKY